MNCGAGLVLALTLAGCGNTVSSKSSAPGADRNSTATPSTPKGPSRDELAQAKVDLDRYADAAAAADPRLRFSVVGDVVQQEGDWEADTGGNNKLALNARLVVFGPDILPALDAAPPLADWPDITWPDGSTTSLPPRSARDTGLTFNAGPSDAACGACTPLEATGASLATMTLETSRGRASVPAWRYTLAGTRVTLLVAALSAAGPITVTPPPWDPDNPRPGRGIDGVTIANRHSRTLTAGFTGSPNNANQPCGADYTATAIESDLALVIAVTEIRSQPDGQTCTSIGAFRTARAHLTSPLGDRAVLELPEGRPVPVTIGPPDTG